MTKVEPGRIFLCLLLITFLLIIGAWSFPLYSQSIEPGGNESSLGAKNENKDVRIERKNIRLKGGCLSKEGPGTLLPAYLFLKTLQIALLILFVIAFIGFFGMICLDVLRGKIRRQRGGFYENVLGIPSRDLYSVGLAKREVNENELDIRRCDQCFWL